MSLDASDTLHYPQKLGRWEGDGPVGTHEVGARETAQPEHEEDLRMRAVAYEIRAVHIVLVFLQVVLEM